MKKHELSVGPANGWIGLDWVRSGTFLVPIMTEMTLREARIAKLEQLKALGMNPFAEERFDLSDTVSQAKQNYELGKSVSTAGRIVSLRLMGKAAFLDLSDGDSRIQIYIRKDDLPGQQWEAVPCLDLGDHLGVNGEFFTTKTGEESIHARSITPLSKALEPPPIAKEKDGQAYSALKDQEVRYRHRHLDLISSHESRKKLLDRSKIVAAVRHFFDGLGYLEVETPMLQAVAGGAAARPFLTHYNAYDMEVKLRISLELYLKKLISGDVPRVYEIGRVFRNEGVSNRHSPEFTLVEWYEAYANLEDMMVRVENLFRAVCLEVYGTTKVGKPGEEVDFGPDWRRIDLLDELKRVAGIEASEFDTLESAKKAMERQGLPTEKENTIGGIVEKLLEKFVEPNLIQPAFVVGYPIDTSPLAKKDPKRPGFTRRFEGYVCGREICNAFSELNDPIDQRERFEAQLHQRAGGDDEAHPMDEDYLYALETGMPPTGGVGIGIDRLVMLLTGAEHVREILLFPMMKPENIE